MRHDKYRRTLLDVSHKVYERCLILYPKDLRGDFGSEMIEVYDEQIADAYSRRGFAGLLRVWFSASRELVTVALPGRFAERAIPIIAVAATLAFMVWFASYIGYVMETACPGCGH
ncbi:MAG TPA: hypothetical protein VMT53_20210 [Terriglobales bacterium]|nr:hypothetical protein [Terriglobales bacterium]